ncbi:hypothetical protein, partial [Lysobacter sp. TAB13]|uniref:hypothetical protein n=1 Tax=Lysobacter sp. TAB13 TaxID=3233065 RepID=UPI003F9E57F0
MLSDTEHERRLVAWGRGILRLLVGEPGGSEENGEALFGTPLRAVSAAQARPHAVAQLARLER